MITHVHIILPAQQHAEWVPNDGFRRAHFLQPNHLLDSFGVGTTSSVLENPARSQTTQWFENGQVTLA